MIVLSRQHEDPPIQLPCDVLFDTHTISEPNAESDRKGAKPRVRKAKGQAGCGEHTRNVPLAPGSDEAGVMQRFRAFG